MRINIASQEGNTLVALGYATHLLKEVDRADAAKELTSKVFAAGSAKEARDLIVEWGEAHVYNIDDGDVPGPDDQGPSICAAIDAALGTEGTR